MKAKIYGTVKKVSLDAKLNVQSISIVPTATYAIKGTLDEKKTLALLRPNDDVGQIISLEYNDVVIVNGKAIAKLTPQLSIGCIIGFIVDDVPTGKSSTNKGKTTDIFKFSGLDTDFVLSEVVFA